MSKLSLPDEGAYREYYVQNLANGPKGLRLADGSTAPIFFDRARFEHAFFRSIQTTSLKRGFELARAERMADIAPTMLDGGADRYVGWDSKARQEDHARCVCVAVDDFVIVLRLGLTAKGTLKGQFITCYVADNSIGKIRSGAPWDEDVCIDRLRGA